MKATSHIGGILLVSVLVACMEDARNSPVVRQDSAGVAIVESASPSWTDSEQWSVDSVPILDLTTSGEGDPHWFFRVSDAICLSDGSIAVTENDSDQVRFYSSDGEFIRAVGGAGDGPGEFRWPHGIDQYRGDSLIVFDPQLGRVTVLSPDGELSRVFPVRLPGAQVWHLHPLDDSTFVARAPLLFVPEERDGLYRKPEALIRFSDSGSVMDTIAIAAGVEEFQFQWESGWMSATPLFVRDSHFSVYRGQVYLGDADEMEFKAYTAHGDLDRIIRAPSFDLSVSAEEAQKEREARLALNDADWNRAILEALPDPQTRPAFSDLVIDSEGFLWAQESRGRILSMTDGEPSFWSVFSPEGEWLGRVRIPFRFSVFDIGPDFILGRRYDEQEVEHVELLRLHRPNDGSQ